MPATPRLLRGQNDGERKLLEVSLLLDALYWRSGTDLRQRSMVQLCPIIETVRQQMGASTITALLERVVHHDADLQQVEDALAILLSAAVSAASANHPIAGNWHQHVLPLLRSMPFSTIWVHDCGDVALLTQLLLLLRDGDLLKRSTVFVTCSKADEVEPLRSLLLHATTGVISSSPSSIIVAEFNINTDGTFNEFDFIVCGSVLRKLSRLAQRRVMRLLGESLAPCGVLQLVGPDVADAARIAPVFLPLVEGEHVYRHALLERCTQQRHRQPS